MEQRKNRLESYCNEEDPIEVQACKVLYFIETFNEALCRNEYPSGTIRSIREALTEIRMALMRPTLRRIYKDRAHDLRNLTTKGIYNDPSGYLLEELHREIQRLVLL